MINRTNTEKRKRYPFPVLDCYQFHFKSSNYMLFSFIQNWFDATAIHLMEMIQRGLLISLTNLKHTMNFGLPSKLWYFRNVNDAFSHGLIQPFESNDQVRWTIGGDGHSDVFKLIQIITALIICHLSYLMVYNLHWILILCLALDGLKSLKFSER